MNKTLARLTRMGPDEIRTRAQQALSKRWARPPAFSIRATSAAPVFPEIPALGSVRKAEKICQHRFDLLGYLDLDFGSPIDWHFDPVHHKRAPREPWYKIPFLDFDLVGDHKIIWELNRHQHLITLAEAWRLTGEDRFADEVRSQWDQWQRENPYPIGINWASTLEVAFRALSWLWVRRVLGDFREDLLRALHLHGWYIERYLSTYYSPNTHLLGEGVALFAIGLLCPQIRTARRWQERGWKIVLRQAETQVRADGMHFEQSVYYHVYALDFFQFTRDLAACNGLSIPASFDQTIAKMKEALSALSQTGFLPNFGDDDGGHMPGAAARSLTPSPPRSVALTAAGIYAMAGPSSQLFIDAGPLGVFAGGHGHADALSVQLIRNGGPVLIDSGTFCYTCPERERFRGTAAHNTLQVDGRDQATPVGPFAWTGMPETAVDYWHVGETLDLFAGHHDGYAPMSHHRWVVGLKSGLWLVRDLVRGAGRHRLDIHWHFLDEGDVTILAPAGHTWSHAVERFDWSPVYGRKETAFVRRFHTEVELPGEFAVMLVVGESGTFTQTGPGSYRFEQREKSHEFIFSDARFVYRASTPKCSEEFSI